MIPEHFIPVNNGVNNDLNWVLISQEVDDFHGMLHNTNSHQLFTIVASMHHERVGKPLNNGTLGFPKSLHLVSTSSMRHKGCMLNGGSTNVIGQGNILDLQEAQIF